MSKILSLPSTGVCFVVVHKFMKLRLNNNIKPNPVIVRIPRRTSMLHDLQTAAQCHCWYKVPKFKMTCMAKSNPTKVRMCWWFAMACDRIGMLRVTVTAYLLQRLNRLQGCSTNAQPCLTYHEFVCDSSPSFTNNRLPHSPSLYITLTIVPPPHRTIACFRLFQALLESPVVLKPAALR